MTFIKREKVTEIEYVKMWGREKERDRERICDDVKMICADVRMRSCADVKMICVDVKMILLDVKMRRPVQITREVKEEFVTHSRLSHTHRNICTQALVQTETYTGIFQTRRPLQISTSTHRSRYTQRV